VYLFCEAIGYWHKYYIHRIRAVAGIGSALVLAIGYWLLAIGYWLVAIG
jgi:hypothetical protein